MRRSIALRMAVLESLGPLRSEIGRSSAQYVEVPPVGPEILALMKREGEWLQQDALNEIKRAARRAKR